ncbi:MAG: hypothetical protein EPO21_17825 [Chloroflexota bacterium]|nr:MAG: hypothetical protein EPO21_17825 [Chloroflexota bacterium]
MPESQLFERAPARAERTIPLDSAPRSGYSLIMSDIRERSPLSDNTIRRWRRTAYSRLRFELEGIAFARENGLAPEDWAQHLWDHGAQEWMGQERPSVGEYVRKEGEAFETLYPAVRFELHEGPGESAEIVFLKGTCLGGWGRDQWGLAHSLGLSKGHVCRYCRRACQLWTTQLGLSGAPEPQTDGTCRYVVRKGH